jgi:hypothetical protein
MDDFRFHLFFKKFTDVRRIITNCRKRATLQDCLTRLFGAKYVLCNEEEDSWTVFKGKEERPKFYNKNWKPDTSMRLAQQHYAAMQCYGQIMMAKKLEE